MISFAFQEITQSLKAVNQHFEQTFGDDNYNNEITEKVQGVCDKAEASTYKLFSLNEINDYEKNLEEFQENIDVLLEYLQDFNEQNDSKYQECLESDI